MPCTCGKLFVHELIASRRGLRSNDHIFFLADLNTTMSRATHDESLLATAAVKLKSRGGGMEE